MPQKNSHWRVNDVVAYDRMREDTVNAFALLANAIQIDGQRADDARAELASVRDDVLSVDAYDRAAVSALATRIDDLIREYEGSASWPPST